MHLFIVVFGQSRARYGFMQIRAKKANGYQKVKWDRKQKLWYENGLFSYRLKPKIANLL